MSDGGGGSGAGGRRHFYCHECSRQLDRVTQEFTCPRCRSGFVEEVQDSDDLTAMDEQPMMFSLPSPSPSHSHSHSTTAEQEARDAVNFIEHLLGPILGIPGMQGMQGMPSIAGAAAVGHPHQHVHVGMDAGPFMMGSSGGGGSRQMPPPVFRLLTNMPGDFQIYGDPGDYAWSRGGFDAILTQLLNQMDGAGPPPLKKDNIKQIPSVKISAEQSESKLQCSVCLEYFQLGESVRKLICDHYFHDPCIVPWLERHATCPVCRKDLQPEGDETSTVSLESDNEDLNEFPPLPGAAASSSSTSTAATPRAQRTTTTESSRRAEASYGGPSASSSQLSNNAVLNSVLNAFNRYYNSDSWASPGSSSTSNSSSTSRTSNNSSRRGRTDGQGSTDRQPSSSNGPNDYEDLELE